MTAQAQNALIPDGWVVRRLKFIASCNDETLPETTDPALEIDYVDISSVELEVGIKSVDRLPFDEAPSRARRIARNGDTIVSTVRTYLKAIAAIRDPSPDLVVSTGFAVLRPMQDLDGRFLAYALQASSFVDAVVANSTGVSYPAINPSELVCLPILFPHDKETQGRIADFLDWKTGQIDTLIAKKRGLIERLKEKRLAVITHAVTRGLHPGGALKESGASWLGSIPSHWEAKRLRYCSSAVTSGSRGWSQFFSNDGALFLRITNLSRDSIQLVMQDVQRVDPPDGEEGSRTSTRSGDLLISITADLGSVAVVPENLESAYVSQHLALVRLDSDAVHPEWIAYSVLSLLGKAQLLMAGYGGTKIQLNLNDIKDIEFCYPPDEQELAETLEHIRASVAKIDSLLERAESTIEALLEYRSAIISAAVTGMLDVRHHAIHAAALSPP